MIELVFPSDTNMALAESALEAARIEVSRGHPGCLNIERPELVNNLDRVDAVLSEYNGRIWAD